MLLISVPSRYNLFIIDNLHMDGYFIWKNTTENISNILRLP